MGTAADFAADQVASVREDPAGRLALPCSLYEAPVSTYLNVVGAAGFALEATDEPPWSPGLGLPDLPFFLVTLAARLIR